MSRVAENIISMLDKGQSVFDIAKFFGGIHELLDITKKYPYLYAMIQTKLGGDLHCSAENEDGVMIPFYLNFILTDLEQINMDDFEKLLYWGNVVEVEWLKYISSRYFLHANKDVARIKMIEERISINKME